MFLFSDEPTMMFLEVPFSARRYRQVRSRIVPRNPALRCNHKYLAGNRPRGCSDAAFLWNQIVKARPCIADQAVKNDRSLSQSRHEVTVMGVELDV